MTATCSELKGGYSRIFGGDAAKQRAQMHRDEMGFGRVIELGTKDAPFAAYGLDPWGRRRDDGIVYSYVAIGAPLAS